MLAEERYKIILNILKENGSVRTTDLVSLLSVSTETIRRDMEYLENKKLLSRVYGGAVSSVVDSPSDKHNKNYISFRTRAEENIKEKYNVANTASSLISEYDSLALDSGTTSLELAKILKVKFKRLTIITNSLMIINELSSADSFTVISTGGLLKPDELSLIGDGAIESINNFHVDKAFVSVSGISLKNGFTDWRLDEIKIQQAMIKISNKVIVLADKSKFNSTSLIKICGFEEIDAIVTDEKIEEEICLKYQSKGIKIYY